MQRDLGYDRQAAAAYARRWALSRNPAFGDFAALGGDCANFASQCLWAGWNRMTAAWHYYSMEDRTPSWSGVRFLRRWLLDSGRAEVCETVEAEAGDLIALWNGQRYYHVLVVLLPGTDPRVAAHTHDVLDRPLSDYTPIAHEALHIL
ncbi:MAG: amidase domain-containing protein [Clostridia bacterium]|nr:amidase domain-containing protein [Clostridia bacterium]